MSADMCTCGELRKAARAVTMLYDDAVKSTGLLSTQFTVLHVIYKSDAIRISDLAARLGMDRTTLTRNLAILERGIDQDLRRKRSPNKKCNGYSKRTWCCNQSYSSVE
jgi:DNA-binding MarR family transcriptional regulator